jgi:hypothetical protein
MTRNLPVKAKGPDAGGLEGAHLEAALQFTRTGVTRAQGRAEELIALLHHLEAVDLQAERDAAPWEVALLAGAIGFAGFFAWMVLGPTLLQATGVAASSSAAFALTAKLNRFIMPAFLVIVGIQAIASRKAREARARDVPDEIRDLLLPVFADLAEAQGAGTRAELELDVGQDSRSPWARARLTLRSGEVLVLEFQDETFVRPGPVPDVLRRGVRAELLAPPGTPPKPVPGEDEETEVPEGLDGLAWTPVRRGAANGTALEAWRSWHGGGEILSPATVRELLDRLLPEDTADAP